jgi:hypothetical protein
VGGISLGGILVIIGIVVAIFWSVLLGVIIALIGLIAFGGFCAGQVVLTSFGQPSPSKPPGCRSRRVRRDPPRHREWPGRSLRGNGLSTRTSVRPSSATHRVQVEETEKTGGEERSYGDSLACDPA